MIGQCHVEIRTGNCCHCLCNRAVSGGLCHRERRRRSWRRSRWWPRRRSSWRWPSWWRRTPFRRPASWRRAIFTAGRRISVRSPAIVHSPLVVLRTPFVLRATHEFRRRRPGAELARTRPQLSPHRSPASSRACGPASPRARRWPGGNTVGPEAAAGGGTATAGTAGSDRCSGRSPISTSMTTRCGDRASARRSGTTATTTSMPACSAPYDYRGPCRLPAAARFARRRARTGWRCCAARTAAKSPACRST